MVYMVDMFLDMDANPTVTQSHSHQHPLRILVETYMRGKTKCFSKDLPLLGLESYVRCEKKTLPKNEGF